MSQNGSTPNGFVGEYVTDVTDVLAAALISRQNLILVGAPGFGKTDISLSFADQLVGEDHVSFIEVDPSTPPDVILGAVDPIAFTNGRIERVISKTPYDPECRIVIADELFRANEVFLDALLKVTERKRVRMAPPVIATTNFIGTGSRIEALRDRFTLWHWLKPGRVDVDAVVEARLNAYAGGEASPVLDISHLPTWNEMTGIWSAIPTLNAKNAIKELLRELENEAFKNGIQSNNRRVVKWTDMMFRLSVWHTGTADFTTVPDKASSILRYAYPAQDATEAVTWKQIALSIVDTVASAIDKTMADLLVVMEKVQQSPADKRGNIIMQAVDAMTKAEKTLKALAPDDARIAEHLDRMKVWYTKASRGEPLE